MTKPQLEKVMLKGEALPGFEGQVFHLIEEASPALIIGAVKQLASEKWRVLSRFGKILLS